MEENKKTCYSLYIENKFNNIYVAKQNMINIYKKLTRIIKNDIRFKDIKIILGVSNTSSLNAKIDYIYTGKKGRPKRIVMGDKIDYHIHIYIYNEKYDNYLVSTFCDKARRSLKNYNTLKRYNNNLQNAKKYLLKQSQYTLKN